MKTWFKGIVVSVGLLAGGIALAATSPQELVQRTADQMLAKLKTEKQVIDQHPERIYELVNQIVLPHFDFERMSSWVLGKYWRAATPAQKQQFMDQFRTLLVRTYAKSLSEYTDNKISYLPMRPSPQENQVKVRTEVDQPGGFPIPIDYELYRKGDDWKVIDVTIDGVSLVNNYRSTFATQIRQDGLDKLITVLSERNQRDVPAPK
ncbi:MAG: ABC transporter substrate-binding protein [Pseudomonadota bacterium]